MMTPACPPLALDVSAEEECSQWQPSSDDDSTSSDEGYVDDPFHRSDAEDREDSDNASTASQRKSRALDEFLAADHGEAASYAGSKSGDESSRPQLTDDEETAPEDEADQGEESVGGQEIQSPSPPPVHEETDPGEQEVDIGSCEGTSRSRILKERMRLGRGSDFMTLEVINITNFDKQMDALIDSKAKVIFFQEHKTLKKDVKRIRRDLKAAGWQIHCGPCNEGGRKAPAGVGVMWRECAVKIYPERIKDLDLRKAYERGTVGKYTLDVGWERAYTVYI